jgi:hypothetical protein
MFDDFYGYDNSGYDDYGCDDMYYEMPLQQGRIPKATKSNVEYEIMCRENNAYLKFVKLETMPDFYNWRHFCGNGGAQLLEPVEFMWVDGSVITYAYCPFCGKVHLHIEKAY